MQFNAEQFCTDNGIETSPAGNKHTRPGWVHIRCPFCHSGSFQGGFNLEAGAVAKWATNVYPAGACVLVSGWACFDAIIGTELICVKLH